MEVAPPAMAATLAHHLYGRFLSSIPIFKGLSSAVIGALCARCKGVFAIKGQFVIREGESGQEMCAPPPEHKYPGRNSELAEIYLRC
jgi:hypothetical protein